MIRNITSFFKQGGLLFIFFCLIMLFHLRTGFITYIALFSIFTFLGVTTKSKLDKCALLIILFELFLVLISSFNGFHYSFSTLIVLSIAPFFFYQFGKDLPKRFKNNGNNLLLVLFVLIFIYGLDVFVIMIENVAQTGQIVGSVRSLTIDESRNQILTATLVGLPMDLAMVGLPMFILVKDKIKRIAFLILFILALLTTFHLLNRTGLVVALLSFVVVVGHHSRKNPKIVFIASMLMVVLYFALIHSGVINQELFDLYDARNEDLATMGSRTERWQDAIVNLFLHPFGWASHGEVYYVHNMWLDVARIAGIIPFFILAYLCYHSARTAFFLVKKYNNELSYLLLGLNVCFLASCFVEPIYGGTHVNLYCLLWGMQNALAQSKNITS